MGPALTGCGSGAGVPPLALRPQPIPYADTLPIHEPAEISKGEILPLLAESTVGELAKPFDPDSWIWKNEALNLTHYDEVVNSAWFEHRITSRELSAAEIRRGPTSEAGEPRPPYEVNRLKGAGISPGFWVQDSKGDVYLLKFDPPENLYLASGANAISSRLFWAAGYHVPEEYVVVLDTAQLVLRDDDESPTGEDVEEVLERTTPLGDGRYRAIASKLLPGPPKGPFSFRDRRKDDPNDYYLHQNRRELRGLYVLSAWTNHVDMRFANTLDIWIDPPGYLRHYLQDFGATLGSGTIRSHNAREGIEYNFDAWAFLARLVTFGFYHAGWEGQEFEVIDPSIGWLPVELYDPGRWKPNWPNDAFRSVTPADGYWGAKVVAKFDDELIRAAVEAAELPDRRAADTLAGILIARRDKTVRYWFNLVSPVESARVECRDSHGGGFVLTFEDLAILAGAQSAFDTHYEWELEDPRRGRRWKGTADPRGPGRQALHVAPTATGSCLPGLSPSHGRVTVSRPGSPRPGSPADPGRPDGPARAFQLEVKVTEERLAVLRVRAVHRQPTTISRPRPATIYLAWIGPEEGYTVVGLEH